MFILSHHKLLFNLFGKKIWLTQFSLCLRFDNYKYPPYKWCIILKSGINYSEFILNTAIVRPTIEIDFEGNIIICTQLK